MKNNKLFILLILGFVGSPSFAQTTSQECDVVDFSQLSHGDAIDSISLFSGTFTLSVTANRNVPEGVVSATAYDTERWSPANPPPYDSPPNDSHLDTQLAFLCNDAANGGKGNCDGIVAMIPDVDFERDSDDSQGGTITFTSSGGEFEIGSYKAVDSDDFGKRIELWVGSTNVGTATDFGNGSVILVDTAPHSTTEAVFKFLGSGGIDDIEVCRTLDAQPAALGDRVWQDLDRDGYQDCEDTNGSGVIGDTISGVADTDGMDPPNLCEPGIDGVEVTLTDCSGNQIGDSVFTSNGGFYRFEGLAGGNYCVEFDQASAATPLGCEAVFSQSIGEIGVADNSDADRTTGEVTDISLADFETNLNVDAGLYCPLPVSLGDRVWHDLNGDGTQNCEDTNDSGVIGDTVDGVADTDGMDPPNLCEPGIDGVLVNLLDSCGEEGTVLMTNTTSGGGYYLFSGLDPNGSYCVEFGKPEDPNFCVDDATEIDLGDPLFTMQDEGSDLADSDAGSDGKSGDINLLGTDDLTVDAGIVCPVKIGDLVWEDDGDGIRQPGEANIDGVAVELFNCGPDGEFGTADDYSEELFRTTEDGGMYMFGGEPAVGQDPGFSLNPGKYYAVFDPESYPNGYSATLPNQGGNEALDSECMPEACIDLTASGAINLDQDCGLLPPPPNCNLVLDKTCSVAPETSDNLLCESAISATTLLYIGPDLQGATVTIAGDKNGFAEYTNVDLVSGVTVLANQNGFTIDSGSELGSKTNISINGVLEIIHTSCSAVYLANQPAPLDSNTPNPPNSDKGDPSPNWFVVNFRDKDGAFVTMPVDDGVFTDSCTFPAEPLPNCDNGEKPEMLTWRYDGGTNGDGNCADSTFFTIVNEDGKLHEDFECEGSVNTGLPITVVDDDNMSYSVNPGESFIVPRDSIGSMMLMDSNGAIQDLVFHTSCSQPLEAQTTAGAITLVGLDDRKGGREVTYQYEVTNLGDDLTGVRVDDIPLGEIASGDTLGIGDTKVYTKTVLVLGEETVNTATASGTLASGEVCSPETAMDMVTVTSFIPPCSLNVELDKVEDDKLKLKVTNTDTRERNITVESLTVSFPEGREHVKELKLDGDFYKRDKANPTVDDTPATFGEADWTNDDITNRQVKPGDTKTLEIVTTKKSDKNGRFEVEVTFAEGCSFTVVVENQQIVTTP